MLRRILPTALLAFTLATPLLAETVTAAYLHCGARQRTTLSGAVEAVGQIGRVDALVLAGIEPGWAGSLEQAWAASGVADVGALMGTSGEAADRMLLLWDRSRLELRDDEVEAFQHQVAGAPAPFFARMRDGAGVNFILGAVNFEGTKGELRALAAIRVAEFAEDESEPIVLLANLDRGIRLEGTDRDGSIGLLTDSRRFEWVRPKPLERTDCNVEFHAGVREFLFLAGRAQDWEASVSNGAEVGDWCERFSPRCCWEPPRCRKCGPWHLPIVATFEPRPPAPALGAFEDAPAPTPGLSERDQILERIDWMQRELQNLRRRVEALEDR